MLNEEYLFLPLTSPQVIQLPPDIKNKRFILSFVLKWRFHICPLKLGNYIIEGYKKASLTNQSLTVSLAAALLANASSLLKNAVGSFDSGDIVPDDMCPATPFPFVIGDSAPAAGGSGGRTGLSSRL